MASHDELSVDRARLAITLIDLTDLSDDRSGAGIAALCEKAARWGTAAVCVWSEHVAQCATALAGTDVGVATVVNFPTGDQPFDDVLDETRRALSDGATEIDLVLPYTAFLAGDIERVSETISSVRSLVAEPGLVKLILETGELDDGAAIRSAAELGVDLGVDFIKTSTGKTATSATPDAVSIMLAAIASSDRRVGLKPSGGIRTFDDAMTYLDLATETMGDGWVSQATFRFGASGLLDALIAVADGADET